MRFCSMVACFFDCHTIQVFDDSMYPSRSAGGGVTRASIASGVGCPYSGSPEFDMIEVIDATRVGCSIAITCTR